MTVNIIYSQFSKEIIVFSARQLSLYLEKLLGEEIIIFNNQKPNLADMNFRLESRGESKNAKDSFSIRISPEGGVISGSNDRSVLLGVYHYLYLLGCRFLAPGEKHEYIPRLHTAGQLAARCDREALLCHRGVCIEGADSLENILDFIDWLPKLGFNSFFLQFKLPYTFMARWYHHEMNPLFQPEAFTGKEAAACTERIIMEAAVRRGLLLHQAGHGWTGEAIGYPCSDWKAASRPPGPEEKPLTALLNGKRGLFHGVPMNTNLCYSSKAVIEKFSDCVAEYCETHPSASYVHVWLADEYNNICECEACRAELPTDQYIRLLNRIDEKLTSRGIAARIVFLLYQELLWPPVKEAFANPERFVLMFAPISRTFERSYGLRGSYGPLPPYERNRISLPVSLDENMVFLQAWREHFQGESFVYDYPLGRAHYGDLGYVHIARVIGEDIRKLEQMKLDGYISCQELRVCLPNALPNYIMGHMLFDGERGFGELLEEYFRACYGQDWQRVLSYLEKMSSLCSCDYFNGKGPRIDEKEAAAMKKLIGLAEAFRLPGPEAESARPPVQNLFWKYLDYHREYSLRLGKALMKLSEGDNRSAQDCWNQFQQLICEKESCFQECLDVYRVTEVSSKYTGFHLEERLAKTL